MGVSVSDHASLPGPYKRFGVPAAKLPEGDLVFFLLDTVPQLNLRCFYAPYETETRGAPRLIPP